MYSKGNGFLEVRVEKSMIRSSSMRSEVPRVCGGNRGVVIVLFVDTGVDRL